MESKETTSKVTELIQMGFTQTEAELGLEYAEGNLERAVELIFSYRDNPSILESNPIP